jgi:hypothetical protein
MKLPFAKFAAAAAVAASLLVASVAWARESDTQRAIPPDRSAIAPTTPVLFSNAGLGRLGDFSGTIVDWSCDPVGSARTSAQCSPEDHEFALKLDGDGGAYPLLLFGNPPDTERLRAGEFTGKRVRVSGIHYSSNGTILVSAIYPLG